MKVATAQLAGDGRIADRVFVTDRAVIVLDGATAFEPVDLDPGAYAEALGEVIADQLDTEPAISIADAVATAIGTAAKRFHLAPGRSPSSTVSVLRVRHAAVNLYALGDSPIFYGADATTSALHDGRLSTVAPAERNAYAAALRAGRGLGDEHRRLLADLQRAERHERNTSAGYWIAETDPAAARHAIVATLDRASITWAVLATDGASDVLTHLGCDWADIAHHHASQLDALLASLARWEARDDPHARQLPRAKRHDDKTIAAVSSVW